VKEDVAEVGTEEEIESGWLEEEAGAEIVPG
jgi:hypothetical protein